MTNYIECAGLKIAKVLHDFVETRALPGTGISNDQLWAGLADILGQFAPENRALLAKRDRLQSQIDDWHSNRRTVPVDMAAYQEFLREIGYLVAEPEPFLIGTTNVDAEIATMAGPQSGRPSGKRKTQTR